MYNIKKERDRERHRSCIDKSTGLLHGGAQSGLRPDELRPLASGVAQGGSSLRRSLLKPGAERLHSSLCLSLSLYIYVFCLIHMYIYTCRTVVVVVVVLLLLLLLLLKLLLLLLLLIITLFIMNILLHTNKMLKHR